MRPAVATARIRENGRIVTRNLCEEHLAEVQGRASPLGGRSLFDEFFSDFFDGFGGGRPAEGRAVAATSSRRRIEQTDVTEYFSDATRSLLQRAAQKALEWGSLDLDAGHLLWAALHDDVVRHVLRQVGADADAIAQQLRRAIQREAENELSRMVLGGTLAPGDLVRVDAQDGRLTFDVEKGGAERAEDVEELEDERRKAESATGEHALAPRP